MSEEENKQQITPLEFLHRKFPLWGVQDRLEFNTVMLREESLTEAMQEFADQQTAAKDKEIERLKANWNEYDNMKKDYNSLTKNAVNKRLFIEAISNQTASLKAEVERLKKENQTLQFSYNGLFEKCKEISTIIKQKDQDIARFKGLLEKYYLQ